MFTRQHQCQIIAAFFLFCMVAKVASAENLLRNGGFEIPDKESTFTQDWQAYRWEDAQASKVELSPDSYSGKYSIKITGLNEKGVNAGVVQSLKAEGGHTYVLRCQVKTLGKVLGSATVSAKDANGKNIKIALPDNRYSRDMTKLVDWKLLTWQFTTPTNTAAVDIRLRGLRGPGEVWFDEVSLADTAEAKKDSSTESAKPAFEDDFSSGALDPAWKIVDGKWEIRNDALFGQGPRAVIVYSKPIGRNLRVEYTTWTEGRPSDLSALLCVNPEARDMKGNQTAKSVSDSGYFFGFGAEYNTLNKIMRGSSLLARSMMEGFTRGIVSGKRHQVVAQRLDDRLTFIIDGKEELQTDDFMSLDVSGKSFGFYIWHTGYMDDVKVYALPETKMTQVAEELKPEIVEHAGFEKDAAGGPPVSMEVKGDGESRVAVLDEPTWVYNEDGEKYMTDQCARIESGKAGEAELVKRFGNLKSGIVDFDILAKKWEGAAVRAGLLDKTGQEVFALVIGSNGTFYAETGKGLEKLCDTIEYRRRTVPTIFSFKPGRWYTLRMTFDAEAGVVRSIGVLNLYTEFQGIYSRNALDQGDYWPLGTGLRFQKDGSAVAGFALKVKGKGDILFDNLCVIGPVGTRKVNGINILRPARVLAGLDFPPRKDPLDLKLYSLRNTATKENFKKKPKWDRNIFGMSVDVVNDPNNPKYAKFTAYGAERFNRLLVRQAFVAENCQMLERSAWYLRQNEAGSPENGLENIQAEIENVLKAGRETDALLQKAYEAYGHAYLNNLDEQELGARFTPAAEALEAGLGQAEKMVDKCLASLPWAALANPSAKVVPCPMPADSSVPAWKDGQWHRNGKPAFFYHAWTAPYMILFQKVLGFEPLGACQSMNALYCTNGEAISRSMFQKFKESANKDKTKYYYFRTMTGIHSCKSSVSSWWYNLHKKDKDVFLSDDKGNYIADVIGKETKSGGLNIALNFWNPEVRKYMEDYHGAIGSAAAEMDGRVLFFYLNQEAVNSVLEKYETGYNASAVAAFRAALEKRYGDIGKLNAGWGAEYKSFGDIIPPSPGGETPSALRYEFQRFRQEGRRDWMKLCGNALQKKNPGVPVQNDFQQFMGGSDVGSFDVPMYFEMGEIVAYHSYNFAKLKASDVWLDSMRKVYGNTIGNGEWGASMGAKEMFEEEFYKANGLRQLFHRLMWGQGMSSISGDSPLENNWVYGVTWSQSRLGYIILRYSATFVPIMMDRAKRMGLPALTVPSVQPDLGILEVTSSFYNGLPRGTLRTGMQEMGKAVEEKGFCWGVFYEKFLLDKRQSLNGVQTLLAPNGICMPEELADMLIEWVKGGGTLIAFAPAGIYDQYGKVSGKLPKAAFGDVNWEHAFYNNWKATGGKGTEAVETMGNVRLYKGGIGKGKVWVFSSVTEYEAMENRALQLAEAATQRSFYSRKGLFDLAARQGEKKRYLYVLNWDPENTVEDDIVVRGNVARVVDEGLRRAMLVPVRREGGTSVFHIRLAPAEGTLLRLEMDKNGIGAKNERAK